MYVLGVTELANHEADSFQFNFNSEINQSDKAYGTQTKKQFHRSGKSLGVVTGSSPVWSAYARSPGRTDCLL